jgi:hypothetical protein
VSLSGCGQPLTQEACAAHTSLAAFIGCRGVHGACCAHAPAARGGRSAAQQVRLPVTSASLVCGRTDPIRVFTVYTCVHIPGRGASHCSGPALRPIPSTLTLGCQQPRPGAASKAHSSRGASGLAPVAVPPPLCLGTPHRPQACGCRQFPGGCTHAVGRADGGPFARPRDLGSDEAPCGASQAPAIPCCACWQHQETFGNTGWVCGRC